MKQAQLPIITDLAIIKANTAKDLGLLIARPSKFYVVVDTSVIVPTHYSEQASLQGFLDNEQGSSILPVLNDYIHILTSKTQLTGTVTVGAGLKSVVGVGTAFGTELSVGDIISIASQEVEVESITDNEHLGLKTYHRYGATGSIAYKVVFEWWRYTGGDGSQQVDYTEVIYDPENYVGDAGAGVLASQSGLYMPDPEKVLSDYTVNFVNDPADGQPFEGTLDGDDYFKSVEDPKSMHVKIFKIAGNWALGVTANIILIVDTDGDLFSIIHSTGADFLDYSEWSVIPEYKFESASILEGMIVDSVNRLIEANSGFAQIEAAYQNVRQIARKMGKNADLVVGTITQNEQQEAEHLINNWIPDLIVGSRTRVLFRIGTHVPDSNWNVTEKTHLDFDRDGKLDMTGRILTLASPNGRVVMVNAGNNSLVITGNCDIFIVETDNESSVDYSGATGIIVINGKATEIEALKAWKDLMTDADADAVINTITEIVAAFNGIPEGDVLNDLINAKVSNTDFLAAIDPVDKVTGYQTQITFESGMMVTKVTVP